jgi:hypothetical protein
MQPPVAFSTSYQSRDDAVEAALRLSGTLGCAEASLAGLFLQGLDQAQAWVAVKEVATARYVSVHPRLAALWGHSVERATGASDADLFEPPVAAALRSADQSFLAHVADGLPVSTTQRMSQGGVVREFQVTRFAPLAWHQHAEPAAVERVPQTHIVSLWLDRSAATQRDARLQQVLQQLEQQQSRLEAMDQILGGGEAVSQTTGVWAARQISQITPGLFDDQLRREMDLSHREHRQFALVLLTMDTPACSTPEAPADSQAVAAPVASSSRLNLARQRMVESLAFLLKNNIRAMDFTCRVSPEGFAVLLSGVGLATASARIEQIRRQYAAQSAVIQGQDWRCSVSSGVASFPLTAQNEADLRQSAEQALAKAAQRGGNQLALAGINWPMQVRTQQGKHCLD